jgi:hypothetical protein
VWLLKAGIYCSQFWRLESPRSKQINIWWGAIWFTDSVFSLTPHMVEGQISPWSLTRTLIPLKGLHPRDLVIFQALLLQAFLKCHLIWKAFLPPHSLFSSLRFLLAALITSQNCNSLPGFLMRRKCPQRQDFVLSQDTVLVSRLASTQTGTHPC